MKNEMYVGERVDGIEARPVDVKLEQGYWMTDENGRIVFVANGGEMRNSRTVSDAYAKRVLNVLKWAEKNGFKEVNLKMDNVVNRFEFLTTMVFRSDLPDGLSMRIQFDKLQMFLYREITNDVYAMIYIDDRDNINFAMAYRVSGKWHIRAVKPNAFRKKLNKMLKYLEVRE